jgi:hypothetical protein
MLKLKMLARETDLPTTIIRQFLLGLEPKPWNWVRPPLQEPQLRLLDGELVEPEVQKVPRAFNDKLGCARKLSGCYFLLPATSHYPKVCLPPVFAYFLEMKTFWGSVAGSPRLARSSPSFWRGKWKATHLKRTARTSSIDNHYFFKTYQNRLTLFFFGLHICFILLHSYWSTLLYFLVTYSNIDI